MNAMIRMGLRQPLFMLNNLDTIGRPVRTASGEAMPAIRVRDFHFTSLSDAV